MRAFISLLIYMWFAAPFLGQAGEALRYAEATPMPMDRAKDSYAIYSQLLRSGPIEWRNVSRKQWLIEDTTNAVPLNIVCGDRLALGFEPHTAVEAPVDRRSDWNEVLHDYDLHCHDVIRLNRQSFRTELPVRLLNAEDKRNFMRDPLQPPAEFADGAGLHRFTEVYFNASHTLALVQQGMWCGRLCGNWTWVVLERKENQWKMLPWVHSYGIIS